MDFVVGGWEYKAIPQAVIGYNGTFLKEEFVLKSFTSEVVDVLCGSNDETCASFVRDSVRSVKLASFYRSVSASLSPCIHIDIDMPCCSLVRSVLLVCFTLSDLLVLYPRSTN